MNTSAFMHVILMTVVRVQNIYFHNNSSGLFLVNKTIYLEEQKYQT